MSKDIFLSVVADDMGMHPAVNEGILKAFEDGLLTDSNLMPIASSFAEAVALAKSHEIPVGLHVSGTCEWEGLWRNRALSGNSTLTDSEGFLKPSVEDAWAQATLEDGWLEIFHQYQAVEMTGLKITHIAEHMGIDASGKFAKVIKRLTKEKSVPHQGRWAKYDDMPYFAFSSTFASSPQFTSYAERKEWLKSKLAGLKSGYHLWITHPALDCPSLDSLCSQNSPVRNWARLFRTLDLQLLLDIEIRDYLEQLEISVVSLKDCPIEGVHIHAG